MTAPLDCWQAILILCLAALMLAWAEGERRK